MYGNSSISVYGTRTRVSTGVSMYGTRVYGTRDRVSMYGNSSISVYGTRTRVSTGVSMYGTRVYGTRDRVSMYGNSSISVWDQDQRGPEYLLEYQCMGPECMGPGTEYQCMGIAVSVYGTRTREDQSIYWSINVWDQSVWDQGYQHVYV
jgi:hypothetical protein